jgi:hypothetical protein
MPGTERIADGFQMAALGSCIGSWWIKGHSAIVPHITKILSNERRAKAVIVAASVCYLAYRRSNPFRTVATLAWWTSHGIHHIMDWSKSAWNRFSWFFASNKTNRPREKRKDLKHLALLVNDDECSAPAQPLGVALHWAGVNGAKFVTIYDACGEISKDILPLCASDMNH